jgi:DNA polymerase III sliding clamp (beta) subunit (PCNA family)
MFTPYSSKAYRRYIQIIQDEDEELSLSQHESILSITTKNLTLSIHTVTGQFPDYRQLFPKEFTTKLL